MSTLRSLLYIISHKLFIRQDQVIFLLGIYLIVRFFIFLRVNYKGKKLYGDLIPLTLGLSLCLYNFMKFYYQTMGELGVLLNSLTLVLPVLFFTALFLYALFRWKQLSTGIRMPVNNKQVHKRKWLLFTIEVCIVAIFLLSIYLNY